MISGDLILAAGIAALALAVAKILHGIDMTIAVSLLFTAAAGIAVQALAREDCDTALAACIAREHAGQVTWHHHVHSPAAVLSLDQLGSGTTRRSGTQRAPKAVELSVIRL